MKNIKNALVTGGAGFIGSHLVDLLLAESVNVIVLDLLTYAGNLNNLADASTHSGYRFVLGDICNTPLVEQILTEHAIDTVFHLAAESHVDNSIENPNAFMQTNIMGTYSLLCASLKYWETNNKRDNFRFMHVSTDEVFGQLNFYDPPFNEQTSYKPNSPYSASKAASDHLVRAWCHTYGLPAIITNCSNNFGPRQHTEKLIPKVIRNALSGNNIPIYGMGLNVRDWLYVTDHCKGIILAAKNGKIGESYCFGGNNELPNIDLVLLICRMLDSILPNKKNLYESNITYIADRKGHDVRYAIDATKAKTELSWQITSDFEISLLETINAFIVFYTAEEKTYA